MDWQEDELCEGEEGEDDVCMGGGDACVGGGDACVGASVVNVH